MRRAHVGWVLGIIGGLLLSGIALAVVSAAAAAPPAPLVAQAGTVAPTTGSSSATAGSGSPASGTSVTSGTIPSGSAVGSPIVGTVPIASIPVPPALPPPIATSSGPSAQQITIAVVAILIGAAIVAVGGWGLIRTIAHTGGTTIRR